METENWQTIKELFHAAMELAPAERAIFLDANCEDEEARREVQNLLVSYDEVGDFIVAPAVVESGLVESSSAIETATERVGEKIGPYEITKEIGRGGMGTVFLAVRADAEFNRQVALKIIKRGMDTDYIVRRFRNERQILASLNHPCIARLFEGGTTRDDLPYFVMEYVDGQDLIRFCQEKDLSLEERLNLFREVCAAVSYAHQNLIVHRDLKPSNILVTPDGVPKLLDFGIAKLLNADDANYEKTTGVIRLFTPEYASPEQIRSEVITTASDVYSLGVILYELLTGQSPYRAKNKGMVDIIQSVCNTEPERPSSVVGGQRTVVSGRGTVDSGQWPVVSKTKEGDHQTTDTERTTNPQSAIRNPKSLRGDLDNIILKALQKEPARRYNSVQEFSEDIRRHLTGLPVTATADTRIYRIGKFIQRHRTGVLASLFMILSLLTGISVAIWQAVKAERERAKSEQRFKDVRQLTNSFIFDFHDAIENLPGSTPARKMVIDRALPFLDNLAQEAAADAPLQNEVAESYSRLGVIQGHPNFSNLGDVSGGLESFRKAIKLEEELVRRHPTEPAYRYNLAKNYDLLGDMYVGAIYDTPNALANYEASLKLREDLRAEYPEDDRLLSALTNSYERIGNIKQKTGDLTAALKYYRDSFAVSQKLLTLEPDDFNAQRSVYVSYYEIGDVLHDMGKYRESLEQFGKGRELLEKMVPAFPNNADIRRMLSYSDQRASKSHIALGEIKEAAALSARSLAEREKLLATDPTNILFYGDVTVSLDQEGDLRVKAGDVPGALKLLERSLEMREAALKQDPTMMLAKRYIAISRNKIGNALRAQNNLSAALVQHQQAVTLDRELCRDDPTNLELRRDLAVSLQGLGEVTGLMAINERRNPEKWREARALLEESLNIYNEMKTNNQFFGDDEAKIKALTAFIEKQEALFNS